jgi:hypothetical protein
MKKDKRYPINLEFCGASTQKYVVRFCGDWLGGFDTLALAEKAAFDFQANREACNHVEGREIIANTNGVQLYFNRVYTVVYGAHVKDSLSRDDALEEFKRCLEHSLGCDGW